MIYTITLNPALDYVMDFSHEKKITKWTRTSKANLIPGGKGINASILLKNIGVDSEALILSGGTTGLMLQSELQKNGIRFKNFDTKSSTRINVKAQFDDTYEFLSEGINLNVGIAQELLIYMESVLKDEDIVLIMGSKMKNLPEDILERITEVVLKKKAQVVYDIASKEVLKLLHYKPLLIKPNRLELSEMFDLGKSPSDEQINQSAKSLLEKGARNVIVSDAEKGALLFSGNTIYETEPLKIKLVNGSGAGDSMVAGFVYKLITTDNKQEALDFANACGAATAASEGIASNTMVEKLLIQKKEKHDR